MKSQHDRNRRREQSLHVRMFVEALPLLMKGSLHRNEAKSVEWGIVSMVCQSTPYQNMLSQDNSYSKCFTGTANTLTCGAVWKSSTNTWTKNAVTRLLNAIVGPMRFTEKDHAGLCYFAVISPHL